MQIFPFCNITKDVATSQNGKYDHKTRKSKHKRYNSVPYFPAIIGISVEPIQQDSLFVTDSFYNNGNISKHYHK